MSSGRRSGPYDMTIETWRASSSLTVASVCRFRRLRDPPGHRRHRLGRQSTRHHATHSIRPDVPDSDVARQPCEPQLRDDQPSGHVRSAASDLLDAGHHIAGDGTPQFGGWIWRYDLVATEPSRTEVTLTYDRTAVPPFPWTTSPTRCATWPSWSNKPHPTAFRRAVAVAERIGNRRPPGASFDAATRT